MAVTSFSRNAWMPLALSFTLLLGVLIGLQLQPLGSKRVTMKVEGQEQTVVMSQAADNEVEEVLRFIESRYVDKVNMKELHEAAIHAILQKLDPHSNYIAASEFTKVNENLEGNFEGVGIQFLLLRDTVFVTEVLRGGPSDKAGLRNGDRVLSVGDSLVSGISTNSERVVKLFRGKKDSEVKIQVYREGNPKPLDFKVVRDRIPLLSVPAAFMVEGQIAYIKVNRFSSTTTKEFVQAVDSLNKIGMKHLILDLRDNGGGYLSAAVEMLNQIFTQKVLLVKTEGRTQSRKEQASGRALYSIDRIAVLINEGSASAAEIVAGAIQDQDRGTLIGRRSFGKGLVQEQYQLSDGGGLRLTVARYFTPSGRLIQKPYGADEDQYDRETGSRKYTGELFFADSIKIQDTSRYFTANGRTVYGGGGIIPDEFVPLEKAFSFSFVALMERYLDYALFDDLKNQSRPTSQDAATFLSSYKVDDQLINRLLARLKKEKISLSPQELTEAMPVVKRIVKAHIAKYWFGENAYHQALTQGDPDVERALFILKKPRITD